MKVCYEKIIFNLDGCGFCHFSLIGLSQPVQAANSASIAGTVTTASGALNVRSSASTSGKIVASLPRGSNVTLLSKSGSWWQVEYADGKYGYVHGDYMKSISGSFAAQVNTSSGNLNVRQGAGTSYAVQTSLPKGKTVVILSQSGGWSKFCITAHAPVSSAANI